jgi:hypothetical protein
LFLYNATVLFDGTGEPEVTVEYIGPEPLGTGAEKYYIQRIMVPPDCSAYSSNSVIVPVAEHVPMDQYDKTTGLMTSFIDIDTAGTELSMVYINVDMTQNFEFIPRSTQTRTFELKRFESKVDLILTTVFRDDNNERIVPKP